MGVPHHRAQSCLQLRLRDRCQRRTRQSTLHPRRPFDRHFGRSKRRTRRGKVAVSINLLNGLSHELSRPVSPFPWLYNHLHLASSSLLHSVIKHLYTNCQTLPILISSPESPSSPFSALSSLHTLVLIVFILNRFMISSSSSHLMSLHLFFYLLIRRENYQLRPTTTELMMRSARNNHPPGHHSIQYHLWDFSSSIRPQ